MPTREITRMPRHRGVTPRRRVNRPRNIRGIARKFLYSLIWMAVFSSAAMTGVAGEVRATAALDRQAVGWKVSEPGLAPDSQRSAAVSPATPEKTDADKFFRAYMLPGTALLVLIISIALVAIFFPRPEIE